MCDCLCEQPTFFDSSKPRARREHRCCECQRTIRVGEVYERANGCWPTLDGFESFATCLDCLAAWKIVSPDNCRCFTGLIEEIQEGPWDDIRKGSSERMTLPLIRVVERYRAYWRKKRKEPQSSTAVTEAEN